MGIFISQNVFTQSGLVLGLAFHILLRSHMSRSFNTFLHDGWLTWQYQLKPESGPKRIYMFIQLLF